MSVSNEQTPTRSVVDRRVARRWLEVERDRLQRLLDDLEAEGLSAASEAESIGEIALVSQHLADVGSETFERERDLTLVQDLRAQHDEVDRALARLAAGRYGMCERCRQPIDPARLEALPTARLCKADEDRYEVGGPYVHEEVPPTSGEDVTAAGFLAADDEFEPELGEDSAGAEEAAVTARDECQGTGPQRRLVGLFGGKGWGGRSSTDQQRSVGA